MLTQTTLSRAITLTGVGVHKGQPSTVRILPARKNTGIVFKRIDLKGQVIDHTVKATYDAVFETTLCTQIKNAYSVVVSTIEHLMAAFAGTGVDNAIVEIDSDEVPIMDGSSKIFVEAILESGIAPIANSSKKAIRILKPIEVEDGDKKVSITPSKAFQVSFEINFSDAAIGHQERSISLTNGAFIQQLSKARTFGRRQDIDALRALGLAKGGSLDNAILVDGDKIINPEGLRYNDEFVRHKMLDAVGDLYLAGAPIIGHYTGKRSGHGMTNALLRSLFAQQDAWTYETVEQLEGVLPHVASQQSVLVWQNPGVSKRAI
jgi:UDP-3-O-[3-hydroxymyristoyl] N-acetylglucosamine deacetylase